MDLKVKTVYEVLAEKGLPVNQTPTGKPVVIHDPCAIRHEIPIHDAVRTLVRNQGLQVEEMPHQGLKTLCCGEGGAVGMLAPELAGQWGQKRKAEAENRVLVTYCVGCSNLLGKLVPTYHLLDLFFEAEATRSGKIKISKSPVTYWNRLRLKKALKKRLPSAVTRERDFWPDRGEITFRIQKRNQAAGTK